MDVESVRTFCLSLPAVTEAIQWEDHLLFKIGGKMFLVLSLNQESPNLFSLKCTPEKFAELVELEGIVPAPYMARNKWVAIQEWNALPQSELKGLIRESYKLVLSKLPKKLQNEVSASI